MYPISQAVAALFEAEQRQILRITGTDKNGAAIYITDADVKGFNIDRFSCTGEKLEVGTACAAGMELKLYNGDGKFNNITFEGAELFVEIGVADWSSYTYGPWTTNTGDTITDNNGETIYFYAGVAPSWIPIGYFTSDEQPRRMTTISIKAMDRMARFDVDITDYVNSLPFPCTVAQLIQRVATICNVPFSQSLSGLPNYNYSLASLPTLQQTITFRNLIQWCAGIMGTCAFIDWTGHLVFKWYTAASYTSTMAKRFSSDLQENDITITGVKYTNTQNVTIVSGTDAYALDMTGNYLASSGIAQILPAVKNALNGFSYRPFTASSIPAPWLWPLDVITFTDKDGVDHSCIVTNVNFGLNGDTELQGKGQTEQINKSATPNAMTPEQALLIEQAAEVTRELDESLDQEGVFNRLTDNGQAQGIYIIDGQVYVNLTYARSGTLVLGGLNNQDGKLEVRDANDNVIGSWNKDGFAVNKGTFDIGASNDGGFFVDTYGNVALGKKPSNFSTFDNNCNFQISRTGQTKVTSLDVYGPAGAENISYYGSIYSAYDSGNYGKALKIIVSGSSVGAADMVAYFGTNYIEIQKATRIFGNFNVYGGTKSREVSTDQYSNRLLYCYETPSPMFGDVGEGVISDDGLCYVTLDAVFAQTVTTSQYQVFLQKYGDGDCWVKARNGAYFIVQGTPGLAFGWEIKAKQRDFDQLRLEKSESKFAPPMQTYGQDAAEYIKNLEDGRIPA